MSGDSEVMPVQMNLHLAELLQQEQSRLLLIAILKLMVQLVM
jgi:hypothetical protein